MTLWNLKIDNFDLELDDLSELEAFLAEHDLLLEDNTDKTIVVRKGEKILGTGSISGNILKSIAVDRAYQGQGLLAVIVNELKKYLFNKSKETTFVYTTREQVPKFETLGFKEIKGINYYPVLLEDNPAGIENYCQKIRSKTEEFLKKAKIPVLENLSVAALVMNCNPITNGHLHLIKRAALENDLVLLFVLTEDLSTFPAGVRYNLVKKATDQLDNVLVIQGGDYILSYATFPGYFVGLNDGIDKIELFSRLDVRIFAEYIARALNIKKRYVGNEPYCPVTAKYNLVLQEVLPEYGIDIIKIKRLEYDNKPISASRVRLLAGQGRWNQVKPLVPETTFKYLLSPAGRIIIQDG